MARSESPRGLYKPQFLPPAGRAGSRDSFVLRDLMVFYGYVSGLVKEAFRRGEV